MQYEFLIAVALLVALDVVCHIVAAVLIVPLFESPPPFRPEEGLPDPAADRIDFLTTHGLQLRGAAFHTPHRPPRGVLLFCAEMGSNRWSAPHYCAGLLANGFDLFAFDFRNQGESDCLPGYTASHWLTEFEIDDVLAAIACIRAQPAWAGLPLGLLGVSRGGGAALIAASRSDSVAGVASDGAYSAADVLLHYARQWGHLYMPGWLFRLIPLWHIRLTLTLVLALSQWKRGCRYPSLHRALKGLTHKPVLMISGELDTYVFPEMTHRLILRAGHAPGDAWIAPGAKHNRARFLNRDEYDQRLIRFSEAWSQPLAKPHVKQELTR